MTDIICPDWEDLLNKSTPAPSTFTVQEVIRMVNTYSKPFQVKGDDGRIYWIKVIRSNGEGASGHAIFLDQIAGHLGRKLDAPIPWVGLGDIPADLSGQGQFAHVPPNLCHAVMDIPNAGAQTNTLCPSEGNKSRYAALAVLYGLIGDGDRQFLYDSENKVWAVDFGHSFGGNPNWNATTLRSFNPPTLPNAFITETGLNTTDLKPIIDKLISLLHNGRGLVDVISTPPDSWGVSREERIALLQKIWARSQQIISSFNA